MGRVLEEAGLPTFYGKLTSTDPRQLSPAARKEAYEKLARLCVARRDGIDSWDAVSRILKDPERLRVGVDYMIEQERRSAHGDPAIET